MSCYSCKNFEELKKPREVEGYTIFGYCFKKNPLYQEITLKGLPIYVPGGSCKDYKRDKSKQDSEEGQIRLEGVN